MDPKKGNDKFQTEQVMIFDGLFFITNKAFAQKSEIVQNVCHSLFASINYN